MTPPQVAAFWVWWQTGLDGKPRSFRQTARILGKDPKTIRQWAAEHDWASLAAEEDRKLQGKVEDLVLGSVLEDAEQIVKRQRHLIAKIYSIIEKALDEMRPTVDQAIRLMEYEASLGREAVQGQGAGFNLTLLMQYLPPEVRGAVHRANAELRRSGHFDLVRSGLGLAGSHRN